ncbi:MAG: aminopeptidase P family protein [bacterium]|nr:aminopeptidase P family protein [bacterium]MDD5354186.1 aminopeptidase P family protein [bacterium]MDD5756332.1 aminopeptidase P family protein [bacterium]
MILQRISKVQQQLLQKKLSAFLVTNPVSLRYVFGIAEEDSFALIARKKAILYVSALNYPEVRHAVKAPGLSIISNRDEIAKCLRSFTTRKIGFESNNLTVHGLSVWQKMLAQAKLVPVAGLIEDLRLVKDKDELILIRKAAHIADAVYKQVRAMIQPGLTEQLIAGKIDALIRGKGCEPAFKTIVASGPGTAVPHHAAGNRKLTKNDLVMLDFGAIYKGYRSDLTRTLFLGKINKLYQCLYDLVAAAQDEAIKSIGPGVRTESIDQAARSVITKAGYGNYFIHSTGHGLGLETHESPRLSNKDTMILQPGMVVTVEPGIYLPNCAGIRIEDVILVTATGREVLTKAAK